MKKNLIIILPVLLIIGVAMGAAWYLKLVTFGPSTSAAAQPTPEPGSIAYQMPERVVNLSDKTGFRYLKIQVTLEFADPAHRPGQLTGDALTQQQTLLSQSLMPYDPAVEDFLITTLTRQTAAGLLTPEGKESLRQQLLDGLRERIPTPSLQAVYFTEFVIQ